METCTVRNRNGFALVLTLLVTALLVALVVEFITEVYVDTSSRQGYVDGQKASLLADSGITGAIFILEQSRGKQTSLKDYWAKPYDFPDETGTIRITIEEENAKLNLNFIAGDNGKFFPAYYSEIATRLFNKLGLPGADLCDALADWRDSNDEPKPGGGETPYYQSRKPPYSARNGRLLTLEELLLVKGFDGDVFNKIRPFVTIYAEPGPATYVNINTAPREVLLALDEKMTDTLVDRIIEKRKTTPFKEIGELETPGFNISAQANTTGSIYRIHSKAEVNGTSRIIESVVSFTEKPPKKLYWREY